MKWLRLIAVVFAGTAWFAAQSHCELEAAGAIPVVPASQESSCCPGSSNDCFDDLCGLVEDGALHLGKNPISVQAPAACDVPSHLASIDPPEPSTGPAFAAAVAEPWIEWLPAWQFERRAVLPARAPAALNA